MSLLGLLPQNSNVLHFLNSHRMLSASVLYELWQLCWRIFASSNQSPPITVSIICQLLLGLFMVATVIGALWRENSLLVCFSVQNLILHLPQLLPYLLMQAVGLCAVYFLGEFGIGPTFQ